EQSRLRPDLLPERRERLRRGPCARHVAGVDALAEFLQRPLRSGFGARRERPVLGPDDNGGPPVPPVQRVAVVAQVALVLGLVGRQLRARGGRAHLVVGHVQRDRFAAGAVWVGPPAEGDLVVDQVGELIVGGVLVLVLVVVVVVVVPPVAAGRLYVPVLLPLVAREHGVA